MYHVMPQYDAAEMEKMMQKTLATCSKYIYLPTQYAWDDEWDDSPDEGVLESSGIDTQNYANRAASSPLNSPQSFPILDLPTELQYEVFDQVIEPWSLRISTHNESCWVDELCSSESAMTYPEHGPDVVLRTHDSFPFMLSLRQIHPQLIPIVERLIRARFEGRVNWSSCGSCFCAAIGSWRFPACVNRLLEKRTEEVSVFGIVSPYKIKHLFPKAKVLYNIQDLPSMRHYKSLVDCRALSRSFEDLMSYICCGALVTWLPKVSRTKPEIALSVRVHPDALPYMDTTIVADMLLTKETTKVVGTHRETRDTFAPFYPKSIDLVEALRVKAQAKDEEFDDRLALCTQ